jgi:hypothetical protein
MPFEEVKPKTGFVHIVRRGEITVSTSLVLAHLSADRVSIFIDKENQKIGIKPSTNGAYKLSKYQNFYRIKCVPVSKVAEGYFYPEWNEEFGMLIFNYGQVHETKAV